MKIKLVILFLLTATLGFSNNWINGNRLDEFGEETGLPLIYLDDAVRCIVVSKDASSLVSGVYGTVLIAELESGNYCVLLKTFKGNSVYTTSERDYTVKLKVGDTIQELKGYSSPDGVYLWEEDMETFTREVIDTTEFSILMTTDKDPNFNIVMKITLDLSLSEATGSSVK